MKTKLLLSFIFLLMMKNTRAQIVEFQQPERTSHAYSFSDSLHVNRQESNQFKFLSGGNIDYLDGGLLQTNAQLFKVNIGNPDGFYAPFYICVGASTETSSNEEDDPNKSTNTSLLNPNGGYLNMGIHGKYTRESWKVGTSDNSFFSFVYQLGFKTINGDDALTLEKVNMVSGICNLGVLYQTQAWNPDDTENLGLAYIQVVLANTINNKDKIERIYGPEVQKHFYGVNIEAGIQVTGYINLKVGYYKYFNNKDINDDFKNGIFKVSLDFFSGN